MARISSFSATIFYLFFYIPSGSWATSPASPQNEGRVVNLQAIQSGGVASESQYCSDIGISMLREKNGSAADAMIATALCVGVVGMHHSGIGGGGFALVQQAGSSEFVDFRETAPNAVNEEVYMTDRNASSVGGRASGVPGQLRGLEYLHKAHGKLPWKDVVAPAMNLSYNGFKISYDLDRYLDNSTKWRGDFLTSDPVWAEDFAPSGTRVRLHDLLSRRRYAATLAEIADKGPDAFYSGRIANSIIAALNATGSNMTLQDLANYNYTIRKVSEIDYREFKLTSTTSPSSGVVTLSMLKSLEKCLDFQPGSDPKSTNALVEAMRYGYGRRTQLGDPAFNSSISDYEHWMLNNSTAENTIIDGDMMHHDWLHYTSAGLADSPDNGTSHIVAVDRDGLAISLTTTINWYFGSLVMTNDTGIIMNNQMDDFYIPKDSSDPAYPNNRIRGNKRPLSSISPAIVSRGDHLYFITGSSGGIQIVSGTLQSLVNVLDRNMTTLAALTELRLHDRLDPNQTYYEWPYVCHKSHYRSSLLKYLTDQGHNTTGMPAGGSCVQAIRVLPDGTLEAEGDPRQYNSGGSIWPDVS